MRVCHRSVPLLALVACQFYRQSTTCDRNSITLEPTSLDFGAVGVGQSATSAFQLTQDSCGAVELEALSVSGSPAFTVVLQDAGQAFLGSSASSVRFAPTALGTFDAILDINTSSSSNPVLELLLTGQGVPPLVACRTDGDCDGGGFCDGTSCQAAVCGPFDNLSDAGGGPACAPESRACPGDAGWDLVDTLSDPRNCRACGTACAPGSGCAGGRCGTCPSYRLGAEQDTPVAIPRFDAGNGVIIAGLALGDFDGDGRPDLLLDLDTRLTGRYGNLVYESSALLIPNDGQGGFGGPPRPISLCGGPLRVGDFNGDCALDVAAAGAILLNDGHGNFPRRNNDPVDFNVDLLVGDVNQDGTPDLIFGEMDEWPAPGPFVAYGDGRGAFRPSASFAPGLALYALTSGDFDGTGRLGVAGYAFNADAGPLYCFANDDAGSLAFEADYPDPLGDASEAPASFAAGDLAGSGHDALVYGEARSVVVLPDPGGGAANALFLGLDAGFAELTVGDLDLDGHPDILATEGRGSWVIGGYRSVFVPDGGFSLDLWTSFGEDGGRLTAGRLQTRPTSVPPSFLQVADLNGDGIPDILAVSAEYSFSAGAAQTPRVMVFLGACP